MPNRRDEDALKENAGQNTNNGQEDDRNAYGWERPKNNFHKTHARAEVEHGYIPPYHKSVSLATPCSTYCFHEDVILAGNLHHQKSKSVAHYTGNIKI